MLGNVNSINGLYDKASLEFVVKILPKDFVI